MAKNQGTIRVRRAEPKDVVNICKLLAKGWNEQTTEYAPIDDICGYRWVISILERGMVAVADLNGRVVGAACANPYQPPWSLQWMLDMQFLYVMPPFRRDGVADRMVKAVEGFADRHGLPLTFTIQTGDRPDTKTRMMRMAGWTETGGHFIRPAKKNNGRNQQHNSDDEFESD